MEKENIKQIQNGDYFIFQGRDIVKVRNRIGENLFSIQTKYKTFLYANIEELQPIVIDVVILERAGFEREINTDLYHYNGISLYFRDIAKIITSKDAKLLMNIFYLHVLQNALRLFGEEVELKL